MGLKNILIHQDCIFGVMVQVGGLSNQALVEWCIVILIFLVFFTSWCSVLLCFGGELGSLGAQGTQCELPWFVPCHSVIRKLRSFSIEDLMDELYEFCRTIVGVLN